MGDPRLRKIRTRQLQNPTPVPWWSMAREMVEPWWHETTTNPLLQQNMYPVQMVVEARDQAGLRASAGKRGHYVSHRVMKRVWRSRDLLPLFILGPVSLRRVLEARS